MRRPPIPLSALLLSAALLLFACRAPAPPRDDTDVFAVEGASALLRPTPEEDAAAIAGEARFLAANYGFAPGRSLRKIRDFRDLLDHPDAVRALHRESVLAFGRALVAAAGYRFEPRDAGDLVRAAAGPPGAALADPAVAGLLARLRARDLLADDSASALIHLSPPAAKGLTRLAGGPDPADRIGAFAALFPFAFSPADAAAVAAAAPGDFSPADSAFLRRLLPALGVRARAAWFPEIRTLLGHPAAATALVAAARGAHVRLAGAGSIIVLSRLIAADPAPLTGPDRERLTALARRAPWPDAGDFLFLVPLCRHPGSAELVRRLGSEYRYRFAPADGPDLLRLLAEGVPPAVRPDWAVRERVPLVAPGEMLGPEPAAAFVDRNDLRFMESLARVKPELARTPRDGLEISIRMRIGRFRIRNRVAAPYDESATDLSRFARPDLLKAWLLLDELDRPEVRREIAGYIETDLADRGSEVGGWVVLGPDGRLRFSVSAAAGEDRNDRLHLDPHPETAALEFHLHATDRDDSAFAGPSSGGPGTDLFRAARYRLDGLVITRLGGGAFDCDLYTSRKAVLDLGVRGGPGRVKEP